MNLLAAYSEQRAAGQAAAEAELDRLLAIAKEGLLTSFIIYELGARVRPELTMVVTDDERDAVERYVANWVIPRRLRRH